MTFIEEHDAHVTIAKIGGQVDSVVAMELENRVTSLLNRGVNSLLLDCSALSYINSAGLRVFLLAAKQLSHTKGQLAFCSLVPNVRLVFETIGFDRILTLYPDRETALREMGAPLSSAAA